MKKLIHLTAILSILISNYHLSAQSVYPNYFDGEIYFKLEDNEPYTPKHDKQGQTDFSEFDFLNDEQLHKKYGLTSIQRTFYFSSAPKLQRTFKVEFSNASKIDELIAELSAQGAIEYAEKIPIHKQHFTPNDPKFTPSDMWHLFKINAEEAWDIGVGSSDIIIGVVDGAITTNHDDLSPSFWTNPGEIPNNNIDDDGNGKIDDINGWDVADDDNNTNPPSTSGNNWNHGSHVSGIAAATTNNNKGIASISHGVSLLPVKTGYSCGSGGVCLRNTNEGVTYAAENGAKVINMSYGSSSYSQTEYNVMQNARNLDVVLVASAGNNGNSNSNYPGSYDNVIAVANTDQQDKKNSQSSYGTWVTISAPGTDIYSTNYSSGNFYNNTGTSMASPLVAGLCGLMRSLNPALTAEEIETCLTSTAVDINGLNPSYSGKLGAGRIDAKAAMECVAATLPPAVANDAGVIEIIQPSGSFCSGTIDPEVTIKNFGSENLTSVTIQYFVDNNAVETYNWSGNLAQNSTENVLLPTVNAASGAHTFTAYTTTVNGVNDSVSNNDTTIVSFEVLGTANPTTTGDSRCGAGVVNLSASVDGNATLNWYDAPIDGNLTNTGLTYSPNISTTTTYYVESTTSYPIQKIGPADNTFSSGGMFTAHDNQGMFFDVESDMVLISVKMYANGAGDRTIELLDGLGGNVLESSTQSLIDGEQRVTLNWSIPPGTGYFIKITGTVDLFRNNDGASFPYSIDGLVSITGSNATPDVYYYYFYDWEVQENGGCTSDRIAVTGTISQNLAINQDSEDVSCQGEEDGSITLTPNGSSPYSYNWNPNVSSSNSAINLNADIYTITVTDNSGCSTVEEIEIEEPSAIVTTITSNDAACGQNNGSASVIADGGNGNFSYNWSNGETGTIINNLSSGNYSVTVTDQKGCSISNSVNVGSEDGPNLSFSSSDISCNNGNDGQISVSIDGGQQPITILWSTGESDNTINNLTAGTYGITVQDGSGCEVTAEQILNEPDPIVIDLTVIDASCGQQNGSITSSVSGGNNGYNYLWNNGSTSSFINNLAVGSYSVTVTDSNGCSKSASANIGSNSGPIVSLTSVDVTCYGKQDGSIASSVTDGNQPYTYNWSNGANGSSIQNLPPSNYTLTVTDNNGCSVTASTSINQPDELLMDATVQHTSCGEDNGFIAVSHTGGTGNVTYTWNTGSNDPTISSLSSGNYSVSVYDSNQCMTSDSYVINGSNPIYLELTSQSISCHGENDGSITSSTNGTSPINYNWSNGSSTPSINNLSEGTYTLSITDDDGCKAIESDYISEPDKITVIVNTTEASCGQQNGTASVSASGGSGSFTMLWSNGSSSSTITNLSAGNYSVSVNDGNSCEIVKYATINNIGAPSLSIYKEDLSCHGDNSGEVWTELSGGNSPFSYIWSNGSTDDYIDNLAANIYSVTVTDANNCQAVNQAEVLEPEELQVDLITSNASCGQNNGSVNSNVSGGTAPFNYNWSNGSNDPSISNLAAGNYYLTLTDNNNCKFVGVASITNSGNHSVEIVGKNISCNGEGDGQATAYVSGGNSPYSYAWSNGSNFNPIANLEVGIYTVTVYDANQCTSTASVTITEPEEIIVYSAVNKAICESANGSIEIDVQGGTSLYSYQWNNGATSSNLTGIPSGHYQLILTDSRGCMDVYNYSVGNMQSLHASVSGNPASCSSASDGKAIVNISAGTSPFNYQWNDDNFQTTQVAVGLSIGSYDVTVSDKHLCEQILSVSITSIPDASLTISSTSSNCSQSNGSAEVWISGGTSPYAYNWSNGANSSTITGIPAGTYSTTVTDRNNCSYSESTTVTDIQGGILTSTVTDPTCYSDSDGSIETTIAESPEPNIYNWSTGDTTKNIYELEAGSYQLTATDPNGCIIIEKFELHNPPQIKIDITAAPNTDSDNCNGSATAIVTDGVTPYIYQWTDPSLQNTPTATDLCEGSYEVSVMDANGCIAFAHAIIDNHVGIKLAEIAENIAIFPNPMGGALNVEVIDNNVSLDLELVNILGKTVLTEQMIPTQKLKQIDVTNLPTGTYFIRIRDAENTLLTQKLIKY